MELNGNLMHCPISSTCENNRNKEIEKQDGSITTKDIWLIEFTKCKRKGLS